MAASLDLTQSGSGTTKISAANGDTVTIKLAHAAFNNTLAEAIAGLGALTQVTGVTVAANNAAGATVPVELRQSGGGTTAIFAANGDTVTLDLASTVENDTLAAANTYLQGLTNQTGVKFAISLAGDAS